MEKVVSLSQQMETRGESDVSGSGGQGGLGLPYVGPRTYVQFMECFCEIYRVKSSEAATERQNLRFVHV